MVLEAISPLGHGQGVDREPLPLEALMKDLLPASPASGDCRCS